MVFLLGFMLAPAPTWTQKKLCLRIPGFNRQFFVQYWFGLFMAHKSHYRDHEQEIL